MVPVTHYAVEVWRAATLVLPAWLRRRLTPGGGPAATSGDAEITLIGVNDWSAQPRPDVVPVVLVHGTETGVGRWRDLAQALLADGHTVFAVSYGREEASVRGRLTGFGTGHLASSAGELALFVDRVLEATGGTRVDIVGHSQGGLLGHLYIKWLGGHRTVRHLVTLGAPVHGASPLGPLDSLAQAPLVGVGLDALLGPSAREQLRVSPVIRELAATPDVVPEVKYTAIVTRHDHAVLPVQAQLLQERDGVEVANRYVQDEAPESVVGHSDLPTDAQVIAMIRDALGAP